MNILINFEWHLMTRNTQLCILCECIIQYKKEIKVKWDIIAYTYGI